MFAMRSTFSPKMHIYLAQKSFESVLIGIFQHTKFVHLFLKHDRIY